MLGTSNSYHWLGRFSSLVQLGLAQRAKPSQTESQAESSQANCIFSSRALGSMEQIGMHSLENACVLPLAPRKLHGAVGMQWLVTFGGKVEAHPTLAWHQLALDAQAAGVAR